MSAAHSDTNAHGHSHLSQVAGQTATRLAISLGLTLAFVGIEALAGVWANSLALLTDAAHNLTDVIALALSLYALRLTTQRANSRRTFGYHRAGILVALANSTTLALIAAGIFYEAYHRLLNPPEVQSTLLIVAGTVAFAVNLGSALLIQRGSEHDLNLHSTYMHLMGDVISTLGAVLAGVAIAFTGANWLDPLVSVLIGLLILWNAWGIVRESVGILLEGTPSDIDMSGVVRDLLGVPGVKGVHDLHVWSITQSLRALSAHIVTADIPISAGAGIQQQINEVLNHKYSIGHATLQLECAECAPDALYCEITEPHAHPEPN